MWIIIFLRIFFWESLNMKVHPILFKHGPFVKRIVLYFQGRNRSFKTSQWLQVKTSTKQLDFPPKKWPKTSDSCIYIYSYIHDTLPEINVDDSCADVFYIWYMIYIYKSYTNILQFRLVLNKSKLLNDIPSPIDSWWQERRVGSRCIWGRSLIDNLQNET